MYPIGELIRTQDNRCTSDPMFLVQQLRRVYGVNTDFTDRTVWMDGDQEEASDEEAAILDALSKSGAEVEGWEKVGFVEHWEFVTACFTGKACEDYLASNGHNLVKPRIYVASGYRNQEWIAIRNHLAEQ